MKPFPNVIRAIAVDRSDEVAAHFRPPETFTLAGPWLSAAEEALARSTAAHEAGHHLVAEAYGLNPQSWLAAPGEGVCLHARGTEEEIEAVGWGGIVAEELLSARKPGRLLPKTTLTATSNWEIYDWASEVREALQRNDPEAVGLSRSDQRCINGFSRNPIPLRAHQLLAGRLSELRELAGEVFDLWRGAIIQARDLTLATIQASAIEPAGGDRKVSYYGESVSRMMKTEARAGETEKRAAELRLNAERLSRQVARLGGLATSRSHAEAAAFHEAACKASFEAAEAARDFNEGWANEFCTLRAAGDSAGARKAAYHVELRTPRHHKRRAAEEAESAVRHQQRASTRP